MKFLIKQRVFSWSDTFDIYDEYEEIFCTGGIFIVGASPACI